ncbi:protein MAIN-LIKE 1-like [Glycine max]|uniref:protein MAIN-LIKE 1-like n=1 Tax=Glycine max TaxID=3847 RepID=UPI0003DED7BF|nr:protein MAIN-LIKE 1-like [Glycine max]|eukprot:XP_006584226.1 protein MAIN-LIKE 1-like [Glycine max]
MVRTRGLARASGSGTGRGTSRDEHDVDVPRRRRPTASTRRQRVQVDVAEEVPQVTEGVPPQVTEDLPPQVTEDIPDQVTEDVPHVDEDMTTADVDAANVAVDGAEGSPVDDGQGFSSGPRDPLVLTSFADHVAYSIWTGKERHELKLVSHGRKVDKIGSLAPEIEGLVADTKLSPLIGCSLITDDPGLIFAFVERWHRETSTFHLLVEELTITLDNVACLLHLPITGALHRFEPLGMDEAVLLLTELLEVSGEEARAETVRDHGLTCDCHGSMMSMRLDARPDIGL